MKPFQKAQAAKLHGPVALANMKKSDEDSPEAFVFEQEVEARLEIAEAKLARLESQVNSLLLRQGGIIRTIIAYVHAVAANDMLFFL